MDKINFEKPVMHDQRLVHTWFNNVIWPINYYCLLQALVNNNDERLSSGWGKSYGHVIMWICVHLAFAVIRATNLFL